MTKMTKIDSSTPSLPEDAARVVDRLKWTAQTEPEPTRSAVSSDALALIQSLSSQLAEVRAERGRWEKHATTGDGVLGRTREKLRAAEAERDRLQNEWDNCDEMLQNCRIEVGELKRQLAEARAEVAEHKRLKNQLVLKAYPAMDAIDEIAEGFRSAVHFVRNNAMNMERDYPEICHAEEVFSRARAASAGKE